LNAFVNLSHLPELQDNAVNDAYQFFKQSYLSYLTCTQDREKTSENFLKLMKEQSHTIRWLEKVTVNLLREKFLPTFTRQAIKEETEQTLAYSELNPQQLNQLYKTIIEASKVLKLLPQANETFVLEKLYLSLEEIVQNK